MWKCYSNKTVLLRDRKRHTARTPPFWTLTCGRGPWTLTLTWGPPDLDLDLGAPDLDPDLDLGGRQTLTWTGGPQTLTWTWGPPDLDWEAPHSRQGAPTLDRGEAPSSTLDRGPPVDRHTK